jgi:hypothetical protein
MSLSQRSQDALLIAASLATSGFQKTEEGALLVPSQATEGAFWITTRNDCTCPDRKYRGSVCKHMIAARLLATLLKAEEDNIDISVAATPRNGKLPTTVRED